MTCVFVIGIRKAPAEEVSRHRLRGRNRADCQGVRMERNTAERRYRDGLGEGYSRTIYHRHFGEVEET